MQNKEEEWEELREKGAGIIHDVWSKWQNYLHLKCKGKTITDENWDRWERQLRTSYNLLSEKEKESDRKVFDEYYKSFISQEKEKSYQKGKEEERKWVNYENAEYECLVKDIRLQTLEEVEKIVKEFREDTRNDGYIQYIPTIDYILQTLNKMKEI